VALARRRGIVWGTGEPPLPNPHRILALDIARTTALVCMAIFHFTFDLEMFAYIPWDTTQHGFWYYFPRLVAGSFLFLAGISLYLAHGRGVRWGAFAKRFVIIAGAAAVVSVGTYYYNPQGMVLFGILHCIAASSLIGLVFLRVPAVVTLLGAGLCFVLPWYVQHPMFNADGLLWLGLSTEKPFMMDYEPLLPWLAPFLAGLAMARWVPWPVVVPSRLGRVLAFPGQHSLIVYLIHQPILIGLIWAYSVMT
jgi:uncharacterized membrane protein